MFVAFLVMNSVCFASVYCQIYYGNGFVFLKIKISCAVLRQSYQSSVEQTPTGWLGEAETRSLFPVWMEGLQSGHFTRYTVWPSAWVVWAVCLTLWAWGSRALQGSARVYPWNQGRTLVKLHAPSWLMMLFLLVKEPVTQKGLFLLTESTSGCHRAVHSRGPILSWFTPHLGRGCNSSRCATDW